MDAQQERKGIDIMFIKAHKKLSVCLLMVVMIMCFVGPAFAIQQPNPSNIYDPGLQPGSNEYGQNEGRTTCNNFGQFLKYLREDFDVQIRGDFVRTANPPNENWKDLI